MLFNYTKFINCASKIIFPIEDKGLELIKLFVHQQCGRYLRHLSSADMNLIECLRQMKYDALLYSITTRWAERGNE